MSKPGTNKVDYEVVNGVAIVTLDHFPVNTLTNAVQLGLEDASNQAGADSKIKAVVVRGAGLRALCAGADIQDLNKKHERYPKKNFFEAFESLDVPVVALLQGFTLGGGMELSLGCHYRVITPTGAVGLPEVNIGLLPGGQGTQRLPRLVGVDAALQIMLTGAHVPAQMAQKMGLVDRILSTGTTSDRDLQLKETLEFVNELVKSKPSLEQRRLSNLPAPKFDEKAFAKHEATVKAKRRLELAPKKIIECVRSCCEAKTFAEGAQAEQEKFGEVLFSKEAQGLQHIFFSERAAAKLPKDLQAKPLHVQKVGVIGAGTMGGGIAMCFAEIGKKVVLVDRSEDLVQKGLEVIKGNYNRSVKRGSKSQKKVDQFLSNISTSSDVKSAVQDCDIVVEAVFEDLELKKKLFKDLDSFTKPQALLVSNTSYLDVDAMAAATKRPAQVAGMHFFSPANVMKLVEVIRGDKSSAATLSTLMSLSSKMGKWPVLSRNSHGFIGNRMLAHYSQAAVRLVLSGLSVQEVDEAAYTFGMPMGPLRMQDLVGLDIGYQARQRLGQVDEKTNIVDALIAKGRRGMKTNKGWYDYNGRDSSVSAESTQVIDVVRSNLKLKAEKLNRQEIQMRMFLPIVNEGYKVLEDGVANQPSDVDTVFVHGYNWPRVTGGVMNYGDQLGPKEVLKQLEALYASTQLQMYKPSQLLKDVAASGKTLQQFWKKNGDKYQFKGSNTNSKL